MDNKKKVAAAVAATIAASGAAVDASFDDPAEILQQTTPEPKIEYVDLEGDADSSPAEDDKQKQAGQKAGALQEAILKLPLAVRVCFVLPIWFVGHLIVTGGGMLFTALTPFWHYILSFLLLALVIAAGFTACAKAMFPDLPLGKILNRHSIKWILIVSAAVYAADLILGMTWAGYAQVRTICTGGFTLVGLGSIATWFARREHRRREKLRAEAAAEAAREPEELVYTSCGETFKIRRPL